MGSEAIFAYKFPLSLVMKLSGALSGLEAQPTMGRAHLKRGLKTKCWETWENAQIRTSKAIAGCRDGPEAKMGSEGTFAYEFPLSLVIKLSGALSGLEAQPNIERAHLKHVKTRGLETKCWETRENAQIRTSKATAGCPRRTGSQNTLGGHFRL